MVYNIQLYWKVGPGPDPPDIHKYHNSVRVELTFGKMCLNERSWSEYSGVHSN